MVAAAFEAAGCRVIGTATSGQAARTLGREAEVGESRTLASLLWRLDHDRLALDERTVVILDEVGMTDDAHLVALTARIEAAGAKLVLVGDHHQLGAVGPGGALAALVRRHPDVVHHLTENRRQHDPGGASHPGGAARRRASPRRSPGTRARAASHAVADRDVALQQAVRRLGCRRGRRARDRPVRVAAGQRRRPQPAGPGVDGSHRAAVRTGAGLPGRPRLPGRRPRRHPRPRGGRQPGHLPAGRHRRRRSVRADADAADRRRPARARSAGTKQDRTASDYGYATTVHRGQGSTTERAHLFADGGGRELAYVAMSRARESTHSLCAYGHEGPCGRTARCCTSLVQSPASGLNAAEAEAFRESEPKALPAQELDHATGYLLAFATMAALARRAREGGSWHVRCSLAQTCHWFRHLGRIDGMSCPDPKFDEVRDYLEDSASGFGRLTAVRHSAIMSETPPRWARPSVPLGTHRPAWPQ